MHQVDYTAGGGNEGLLRPSRDDVGMWVGIWHHYSEAVVIETRKIICNIILDTRNMLDTNIEVIVSSTKIYHTNKSHNLREFTGSFLPHINYTLVVTVD